MKKHHMKIWLAALVISLTAVSVFASYYAQNKTYYRGKASSRANDIASLGDLKNQLYTSILNNVGDAAQTVRIADLAFGRKRAKLPTSAIRHPELGPPNPCPPLWQNEVPVIKFTICGCKMLSLPAQQAQQINRWKSSYAHSNATCESKGKFIYRPDRRNSIRHVYWLLTTVS